MASVRFCKSVACSISIDCPVCILKDNRTHRMDPVHTNVRYACSYFYSVSPENNRTGRKYIKWNCNLPGRWVTVNCSNSFDDTWRTGGGKLFPEII